MPNRFDRDWDRDRYLGSDRDPRNRGEFSADPFGRGGELGGYYARDTHRDFSDDYARDRGWSGGGSHDDYARENRYGGAPRQTFRGRGPKNWKRSDERIREVVNELLTDHDGIDATDVEVTVQDGEVTLEGQVGSRWEKRLAEDIAANCGGVHDVHNRLKVADRERQIGKTSE